MAQREVPPYLAGIVLAGFFLLLIANAIWAYRDARRRGKSGFLVALMILILPFPLGAFAWVIFRPKLPPIP